MLDRLAQLIVDRLRPQLEQVIDEHFKELKADVCNQLDTAHSDFNIAVSKALPQIKRELKTEITQQIVRGVKR